MFEIKMCMCSRMGILYSSNDLNKSTFSFFNTKMVLSLNLECKGELYREFYGRIIDQIPLLLASGRVPLSTKQLMERRIEVRDADFGKQYKGTAHEASIQAVRDSIWTNYFDTGDGVLYHPDGKIKVVVNAPFLRSLNPESKLSNGALVAEIPSLEELPRAAVKKIVSLEEMIENLSVRIRSSMKVSFREFSNYGKAEKVNVIVSFLAMLELVKRGIID